MDAAAQLEKLKNEMEELRNENEVLLKTIIQMKRSLDRMIVKYIEDGIDKA